MKLYLVHGFIKTPTTCETVATWVGSQAEAATARKNFIEKGAKRADLTTDEINVPVDKAGLIEFLNRGQYT